MSVLGSAVIFLAATVIAVPIFKKFKLGAILGYLVAGLVIGPQVMNWVNDPVTILHFAELGVVLLLFVIGLELQPEKLWRMRNQILFTGGGQLLISALVIALILHFMMAFSWSISLVIGLALALSSTAFAVQLMTEHRILKSPPGQQGFSILLMQDLAVIPILLLVENLSTSSGQSTPPWWISVLAIVAVLAVGRYLTNPFLRLVSKYGSEEVMTAAALLIVIATAVGMQEAGLSMGMGAFVAGILLANSSFRHQLETEIEPFKGLLLGLFFIAIGMNLDLSLLVSKPLFILSASVILVLVKTGIIFAILKMAKQRKTDAIRVGLMLSQGGEFAFVVMAQASGNGLLPLQISSEVTLIVGISMALTAPLVILHSLWFNSRDCPAVYDSSPDLNEPEVLIAGFGRFGQVSGRILAANNILFTALDKDAEHIEFVRQFGNKVFFGDACRLDLLVAAGIEHAKVILVAVDDEDDALKISELVRKHFPDVKVIARARNRYTAVKLYNLGIKTNVREVFAGGLEAANMMLQAYGLSETEANGLIDIFAAHDKSLLETTMMQNMDFNQLIAVSKKGRQELQNLFEEDKQNID
ncbi:monovalent cation:proton antiporter-2 (CPA2) family protein [Paraglaciecola psychrophila]|uniref:Potassium efflux system protein n=1 Tax=Paraglaciecola psychrophila 170 TaxID=1129794 RepID=K7A4X8_9ALTE|nr:monovalent cation:proton antiporter-2 (CPA2) family protein [Paraglaciecola psychrophila]AGH43696.1 potassium efflux system protein [Paraglaciecola psychrophila 170]GAC35908.1 glutathione-regulated potassium-efflux system protein kefC [Paraglaciecola psychrophila 170]